MMKLENKVKSKSRLQTNIKLFVKHPFFGFIIAGAVLLIFGFLHKYGDQVVSVANFRAIGKMMIYYVVALGFLLLLGYAGLSSLGTAGFIGLGTYLMGYVTTTFKYEGNNFEGLGLPVILGFIVAVIVAVIVGTVVGFISLRIEGLYLAIITLGLAEILVEFFREARALTNGADLLLMRGVTLFGERLDRHNSFMLLILVTVGLMMLVSNIINSPSGRAMLSMKNSSSAAQAMGMSLLKYRLIAFILATVFAVLGGTFYVLFYQSSGPNEWNLTLSLNILAAVVVGGSKSIWGTFLGSFVIFGFDEIVLKTIPFFKNNNNASSIVSGVLIIVVILFYPGGIVRLGHDLKELYIKTKNKLKSKLRKGAYGDDEAYQETKDEFIIKLRQEAWR